MFNVEEKILIYLDTNKVEIYQLKNTRINRIEQKKVAFEECQNNNSLLKKLDSFFEELTNRVDNINNERIRLYAVGIFQKLKESEKNEIIVHIFVHYGLCFNIINNHLEKFYLQNSIKKLGNQNMMQGLICQEFEKVVVCGSFQQHLKEISNIVKNLQNQGVQVLSPWTTKVVPESLGTDFILLEGQKLINKRDAWRHKFEHMKKFKEADAIIVCNPDGIIGQGTMFEFGFMVAFSKRIIFTNSPKNLSIPFPYEIGMNLM